MFLIIITACIAVTFLARKEGLLYYISDPYVCFFSPTIVLFSCCAFALFGLLDIKTNLHRVSSVTLFVYLFHYAVLIVMRKVIGLVHLPEILSIMVLFVLVSLISFLIGYAFEKLWNKLVQKFDWKRKWDSMTIWNKF